MISEEGKMKCYKCRHEAVAFREESGSFYIAYCKICLDEQRKKDEKESESVEISYY